MQLDVAGLVDYAATGSYVVGIGSSWQFEPVGTVVTAKSWDFAKQTTTIQTGYLELDIAGAFDVPGLSDFRAVGRAIKRQDERVAALEQQVGCPPVRSPLPGVSTPATATPSKPKLYEAISDESGGYIRVQQLNSDGTRDPETETTLRVLP